MAASSSFWSHFEESALGERDVDLLRKTPQRAEPDCYRPLILGGTRTMTETCEQDDQDPDPRRFAAIPPGVSCGTQTMTRTREEPDQDRGGCGAIPISAGSKTQTMTMVREEPDQDHSTHKALGLPRATASNA